MIFLFFRWKNESVKVKKLYLLSQEISRCFTDYTIKTQIFIMAEEKIVNVQELQR